MKTYTKLLIILLFPFVLSYSQSKLSGFIVDSLTNEPLIGANIVIEGTQLGSMTDVNGHYFILGIPDTTTCKLNVSYIGYGRKEYTVTFTQKCSKVLDVTLNTDLKIACGLIIHARQPDSISTKKNSK